MNDHTLFLCLQITRADIMLQVKWAVSLVIATLLQCSAGVCVGMYGSTYSHQPWECTQMNITAFMEADQQYNLFTGDFIQRYLPIKCECGRMCRTSIYNMMWSTFVWSQPETDNNCFRAQPYIIWYQCTHNEVWIHTLGTTMWWYLE